MLLAGRRCCQDGGILRLESFDPPQRSVIPVLKGIFPTVLTCQKTVAAADINGISTKVPGKKTRRSPVASRQRTRYIQGLFRRPGRDTPGKKEHRKSLHRCRLPSGTGRQTVEISSQRAGRGLVAASGSSNNDNGESNLSQKSG